jgi:hypothetical protein
MYKHARAPILITKTSYEDRYKKRGKRKAARRTKITLADHQKIWPRSAAQAASARRTAAELPGWKIKLASLSSPAEPNMARERQRGQVSRSQEAVSRSAASRLVSTLHGSPSLDVASKESHGLVEIRLGPALQGVNAQNPALMSRVARRGLKNLKGAAIRGRQIKASPDDRSKQVQAVKQKPPIRKLEVVPWASLWHNGDAHLAQRWVRIAVNEEAPTTPKQKKAKKSVKPRKKASASKTSKRRKPKKKRAKHRDVFSAMRRLPGAGFSRQ